MKNKNLPPIIGDGITDDTEAIQAHIDAGVPIDMIIKEGKTILITKPLHLPSNYVIKFDKEVKKALKTLVTK